MDQLAPPPLGSEGMNCSLQYDGDIAGTGVRLSFYFQNFILVLLVDRSEEDAGSALWTFIATSFGLVVAALVQVQFRLLTLLEGILVSQLTWLANLGTFLALASYSRSKGKDNLVKVVAVVQAYLSMILTIVMWAFSSHLHGVGETNDCVRFYFLFAVDLLAVKEGKIVALVFASLTMLIYTGVTYTEFMGWWEHGESRIPARETTIELDQESAAGMSRHNRLGSIASSRSLGHRRTGAHSRNRRWERWQWLGVEVDPILVGIFLTQILLFAYFICTTEMIVHQKGAKVSDSNQWGFGQVLALAVVTPSAIALGRAMRTNRVGKQKKENEVHPLEPSISPASETQENDRKRRVFLGGPTVRSSTNGAFLAPPRPGVIPGNSSMSSGSSVNLDVP